MKQRAFTFIELILVLALVGVLFSLVGFRTGTFTFWKEEGFIRNFSETTRYLFGQAAADQVVYQLEIDLAKNTYRVGALVEDAPTFTNFNATNANPTSDLGNLSLELAMILNPASITGEENPNERGQNLIPPPSFPSLFEPQTLPNGMRFISIRTARQSVRIDDTSRVQRGYVYFASGGFSDFASIELEQSNGEIVTFVINPFTTQVDIYRGISEIRFEDLFQMPNSQDTRQNSISGQSL